MRRLKSLGRSIRLAVHMSESTESASFPDVPNVFQIIAFAVGDSLHVDMFQIPL